MARAATAERETSAKTRIESIMAAAAQNNPNQAIRVQVMKMFDEALFSSRNFGDALVILWGKGIEAGLAAAPAPRKRKPRAAAPANGAQASEQAQAPRD